MYVVHDDVFIKDCEKQKGWTYYHHFSFKKRENGQVLTRKEILFPFLVKKIMNLVWAIADQMVCE